MAKKTNVVANENNSIIATNVENVATNSVKVEDSTKGFFDSLAALSSADSAGGRVPRLKDTSLTVYDSPQKSAIIDQIKAHYKDSAPTFEYKLIFCYENDTLEGWDSVFGDLKNSPFLDKNLVKTLGLGGCLSLWFGRLPLDSANKVRVFCNKNAPTEKYKDCTLVELIQYINNSHKDLLNVLAVSSLSVSDISVGDSIVAWYDNNTCGKYTYYSDGLYYSAVQNSVPGWLSAISSLSVLVNWRLLQVRNKMSAQRYNRESVINYLLDVLRAGDIKDYSSLEEITKSAFSRWCEESKKHIETEKEKLLNRKTALLTQINIELEKKMMFAEKMKHFDWLVSYLGGLEVVRSCRSVYSDVFLYSVDEIYKYYSPLYSKAAHKKTASGLKKSDSVLKTLQNSLAKVEKELLELENK